MRIYTLGALFKTILGAGLLRLVYHYVHVYEQPLIGLSLGFLGVFLTVWGASYFFFLICYRLFSHRGEIRQQSLSYTHSLVLGIWVMINLTLMITNHRSIRVGILSLIVFAALHLAVAHESKATL